MSFKENPRLSFPYNIVPSPSISSNKNSLKSNKGFSPRYGKLARLFFKLWSGQRASQISCPPALAPSAFLSASYIYEWRTNNHGHAPPNQPYLLQQHTFIDHTDTKIAI